MKKSKSPITLCKGRKLCKSQCYNCKRLATTREHPDYATWLRPQIWVYIKCQSQIPIEKEKDIRLR